ncbi:unnamed protein product [Linum tenue]|uniref:NAC domain-containing protein n=1 Tax=Linum tenue TaxID=586396 RepID=A0AAV0RCR9_9ROSI|nr:unnamed protein product [Linum tenue]
MVGNTRLPPGFRFHPTDVELVRFYLKRKVMGKKLPFHCIEELDLYKFPPWDLPQKSVLRTGDLKWYFFCPREKKYASGTRMNRATEFGYWKTTGKDRTVSYDNEVSGMIKTLVFHRGKAPKGERTDWVMYEYRLEDKKLTESGIAQDSYVLSVIFKKDGPGPKNGAQYGAPFKEEDWELEDNDEEEVNDIGAALWAGGSTTPPSKGLSVDPVSSVPEGSCVVSPLSCLSTEKANAYEAPVTPGTVNATTEGVSQALAPVHEAQLVVPEEPLESALISSIGVPEAGNGEYDDDDVLAMLANFSEEAPYTLDDFQNTEMINNPNQVGVISNPDQAVALPSCPALDGNEIYRNLGDIGNLATYSAPQGLINGYVVEHNNADFMELVDLDAPLNSFQQQQHHNQYGDPLRLQQNNYNMYNNNNNDGVCDDLMDFVNSCWKHSDGGP